MLDVAPDDAARLTATAPARRLGLTGKGSSAVGADADLVLVRSQPTQLGEADLHDRHRHNPYVGRTFGHRIVRTILRGQTIWDGSTFGPPSGSAHPPMKSTTTGAGNAPIASPRRNSSATAWRPSSP